MQEQDTIEPFIDTTICTGQRYVGPKLTIRKDSLVPKEFDNVTKHIHITHVLSSILKSWRVYECYFLTILSQCRVRRDHRSLRVDCVSNSYARVARNELYELALKLAGLVDKDEGNEF